jgi:hypothetical protein
MVIVGLFSIEEIASTSGYSLDIDFSSKYKAPKSQKEFQKLLKDSHIKQYNGYRLKVRTQGDKSTVSVRGEKRYINKGICLSHVGGRNDPDKRIVLPSHVGKAVIDITPHEGYTKAAIVISEDNSALLADGLYVSVLAVELSGKGTNSSDTISFDLKLKGSGTKRIDVAKEVKKRVKNSRASWIIKEMTIMATRTDDFVISKISLY